MLFLRPFRSRLAVCLALAALALAGCANSFSITTNGRSQDISGSHSSLVTRNGIQALDVCGEYPVIPFATDTGGSVCVTVEFEPSVLSSLRAPATLTVSGRSTRTGVGATQTATFVADPSHNGAIRTVWMQYDCFCPNPSEATFHGTVVLDAIETRHLGGSLELDVTERTSGSTFTTSHHVSAHFSASN